MAAGTMSFASPAVQHSCRNLSEVRNCPGALLTTGSRTPACRFAVHAPPLSWALVAVQELKGFSLQHSALPQQHRRRSSLACRGAWLKRLYVSLPLAPLPVCHVRGRLAAIGLPKSTNGSDTASLLGFTGRGVCSHAATSQVLVPLLHIDWHWLKPTPARPRHCTGGEGVKRSDVWRAQ